jgi:tetratricopeptide (TPR) repeat protein
VRRGVLAAVLSLSVAFVAAQSDRAHDFFGRGVALLDKGDKPAALEQFRFAARLDPKLPFVHREIGLILLDRRDFAGAAAAFHEAARQDPRDFDSRYNLALSLANAGKVKEGIAQVRRLILDKPGWALPFFGLGHMYVLAGEPRQADQALQTAIRLDPTMYRAHFELGKLLDKEGDIEGAIEAYQGAVKATPDSAAARHRLAMLLQRTGKRDQASEEFEAARRIRENRANGEQAATAYQQALEMIERDEFEAAFATLNRAAGLRPDFPEIQAALAEAHLHWGVKLEQEGRFSEAAAQFLEVLKRKADAETENHAGVLLAKAGQLDAAIESFRRALALEPEFRNAEVNLHQALRLKLESNSASK